MLAGIYPAQAKELLLQQTDSPEKQNLQQKKILNLAVGNQKNWTPDFTPSRIAIGNPAVLDVKVLRNGDKAKPGAAQLLLTAKGAGSTSLVLWPRQGGAAEQWEVQVSGPQLILERRLTSMVDHAGVLAAYRSGKQDQGMVLDRTQIDVRSNTVQVDVQVVEFKKSAMKKVGLNFGSNGPNCWVPDDWLLKNKRPLLHSREVLKAVLATWQTSAKELPC